MTQLNTHIIEVQQVPPLPLAPPPSPPPEAITAGTLIDHFRVLRLLGRGGMGEVYLARDTLLGRKVALKVISAGAVHSARARELFLDEARATADLNHQHIVTIHSVGTFGKQPYLALEFLDGQTLRERLHDETRGEQETLRIGLAIADALREAHAHAISHRDLKPENILLPKDGRLRVLDFGLANVDTEAAADARAPTLPRLEAYEGQPYSSLTIGSSILGTPAYMAPEQWLLRGIGDRADIWALGLILYELVTRTHPYAGLPIPELARTVPRPEPVPGLEKLASTNGDLAELIKSCLAKLPDDRPTAKEVVEELEALLGVGQVRLSTEQNPFRGLRAFSDSDGAFFFGRDDESAILVERLREEPVVAVVGPSGAGKSSFVRAGVVPRLREQGPCTVIAVRPGSEPFEALAARLLSAAGSPTMQSQASGVSLWSALVTHGVSAHGREDRAERRASLGEELRKNPRRLAVYLEALAEQLCSKVLLLVDQLEEVRTLVSDDAERLAFLEAIATAADDALSPVRVVFTVRDDFFGRLVGASPELRRLSRVMVLQTPDAAALAETLERPLALVGYRFDDTGLARRMAAEVANEPAPLPLLQFAALRMWEQRDSTKRMLLASTHAAMGGVGGALAAHAERSIEGLAAEEIDVVRQIFLRLMTPQGTRRVTNTQALLEGLPGKAADLLHRLSEARLVVARRGSDGGDQRLELPHEAIVSTWTRLSRWLLESHEDLLFLSQLQQAAELWEKRERKGEEVWTGDVLRDAERRIRTLESKVPGVVAEFLAAGAARTQDLEQKELTLRASAQLESARAAQSKGELLEARAKVRDVLETVDLPEARLLWSRLSAERRLWRFEAPAFLDKVCFCPDGRTVAMSCRDHLIYLLDVETRQYTTLRGHPDSGVSSVGYCRDGSRLISGGEDGWLVDWDLSAGTHSRWRGHTSEIYQVRFTLDDRYFATSAFDRALCIWETKTHALVRRIDLAGLPLELEFDTKAERLLAACADGVVRVFHLKEDWREVVLSGKPGITIFGAAWVKNCEQIVGGDREGTVFTWDASSGALVSTSHTRGMIRAVALSPDGQTIAIGGVNSELRREGRPTEKLALGGRIQDVEFSPDGTRIAALVGQSLWMLKADVGNELTGADTAGHSATINRTFFRPGRDEILSGSEDGTVRLWDRRSAQSRVIFASKLSIVSMAVSHDGRLLAVALEDYSIELWEVDGARAAPSMRGHGYHVNDVRFSADDQRLVSVSGDRSMCTWDVATGALLERLPLGHDACAIGLAFGPGDRTIASASNDNTVRLWDRAQGTLLGTLDGHGGTLGGVEFLPGGNELVTASSDCTVRVWDLVSRTNRVLAELPAMALWLTVDPAGQRVAIGTSRGAYLVDIASGTIRTVPGHEERAVRSLNFSADGSLLVSGSDDCSVRVWDVETLAPAWRAPAVLPASLEVLTHRGWSRLDGGSVSATARRWRDAVAAARSASASDDEGLLCVTTGEDDFALWDLVEDRRLFARTVPGLRRALATSTGCVVLASGVVTIFTRAGEARAVAVGAREISCVGERVQILADTKLLLADRAGNIVDAFPIVDNATVAAVCGEQIVVGFVEGQLQVLDRACATVRFLDGTPPQPVRRILPGPMNTVIAAFADGTFGIWSLHDGACLERRRVHGGVTEVLLKKNAVYALSDLGAADHIDLAVFARQRDKLLADVRQQVPVVWKLGTVQRA